MWRRLLRGRRGKDKEERGERQAQPPPLPRVGAEPNDLSLLAEKGLEPGRTLEGVRILDPLFNDVLEEALSREEELFNEFARSLNSRYCIKLVRDEMFLSNFTLLGTPVIRADDISLRLLAALLVLLAEKDRSGKFLGIMKTGEGEVRAYRDGNGRVSGISITNRDLGGDCLHHVRALSRLKGKAVIYRSEDL